MADATELPRPLSMEWKNVYDTYEGGGKFFWKRGERTKNCMITRGLMH